MTQQSRLGKLFKARTVTFAVALTAIALPMAHAGVVFDLPGVGGYGGISGFTNPNPCSGCIVDISGLTTGYLPVGGNGIQGVTFAGVATLTSTDGAPVQLDISALGSASGVFTDDTLPVDYIFSVNPGLGRFDGWQVLFCLGDSAGCGRSFQDNGGQLDVNKTAFFTGLTGDAPFNWEMLVILTWEPAGRGDVLTVDLPLDLNSNAPEPATILPVLAGAGLLMTVRRRKHI